MYNLPCVIKEGVSLGALDGQPPSKLRTAVAHAVKTLEMKSCSCTRGQKGRTVALRLVQTVKRDPSQWGTFVPDEDENAKYKKVCFCTKLFKNTIFTMYE